MDTKEKLSLLKTWQETYETMNKTMKVFEDGIGCDIGESPLYDMVWKTFETYTQTVAMALTGKLNVKSEADWLDWYCYENAMGANGWEAKNNSWKKMKKIKTLKDLLKGIED